MATKLKTFSELADDIGVHRQTLWRRLRPHLKQFDCYGERKRFYNEAEQEEVKRLFNRRK